MGGKEREIRISKQVEEEPDEKIQSCYRAEGHRWVGEKGSEVCINCGESKD